MSVYQATIQRKITQKEHDDQPGDAPRLEFEAVQLTIVNASGLEEAGRAIDEEIRLRGLQDGHDWHLAYFHAPEPNHKLLDCAKADPTKT